MLLAKHFGVASACLGQVEQERQKPGHRGRHRLNQIIYGVRFRRCWAFYDRIDVAMRPLSLQTLPCTPQRNRLAPALLYEPPFLLLTGSLAGALPAIRAAEGGARRTGKAIASRIGLPVAAGLDETAMCRADAANKHFVEEAANY
jgi:hypothetical protein